MLGSTGLPTREVDVVGCAARRGGDPVIEVGPDQTREVRVLVTDVQRYAAGASTPITFTLIESQTGEQRRERRDHFFGP